MTAEQPAARWHDLHDLIAACERMFMDAGTKDEPDDAFVMLPGAKGDLTFGMIRRARKAHDALTMEVPRG